MKGFKSLLRPCHPNIHVYVYNTGGFSICDSSNKNDINNDDKVNDDKNDGNNNPDSYDDNGNNDVITMIW